MNSTSRLRDKPRPRLVIAEDDQDDQVLIRDALIQNGFPVEELQFVNDGEELIQLLKSLKHEPSIILLDLNMPRKDGREALQEIKSTDEYKHIPVIIFTTSSSEEDIRLTYQSGANSFFTKPAVYDELVSMTGLIKKYWLETALLSPAY